MAHPLLIVVVLAQLAPSRVVYPVQELPLSFSHARHKARVPACLPCHERATSSVRAADDLLPAEAACVACHAVERRSPDGRCGLCHTGPIAPAPARVVVPAPNLAFNHKLHAERKIDCAVCHGEIAAGKVDLATRADLPREALCLHCHDGRTAAASCTTCHPAVKGGLLRTDFPEGLLTPASHDLHFRTGHARVAAAEERTCASCHERRFCQDCHDGVTRPMELHGNDYVTLHAVDARRNTPDCGACHRRQTFCTGCHTRTGVGDDPRTSQYGRPSKDGPSAPNQFHPPGWWTTNDVGQRGPAHHAFQAQRNLSACASCHREDFCRDCHAQKVDPHPPGWATSRRCAALLAGNARVCRRCHTAKEPLRCE